MTKRSPEQTARNGVVLGTILVVCLTWLETLFEHAPMGPKNARFGVVSHEIWLPKVRARSRDFGTRDCCLPGLEMASFMEGILLHVVRKLRTRAFQNAKNHGEQSNGLGDMAPQSGRDFGTRECCVPGHRMFKEAYLPRESSDWGKEVVHRYLLKE